ncbi:MAG: MFS transporter, partial [Gammaproteobacteria bacterium]|nr:MFS transporter [Gammaproteobacteria bacterium]
MPAAQAPAKASDEEALPQRTLFFYGLANMPAEMAIIPVAALIPNYYGQDLGVSLAAVGTVLLLSRIFDAVSDPLIGWLSDRTQSRWGRRRVWMAASVPILMLAVYKLFVPEPPVTAAYLFGWLVVLWLGWTMLFIPYYAWGAELSPHYHQRTRVTGWRAWLGMAANASSKAAPWLVGVLFGYAGIRANLNVLTVMILTLIPITVGLTLFNVPEGRNYRPARVALLPGLKIM